MKKIFPVAILCGVLLFSCKEQEVTFCYECVSTVTMDDGTGEVEMPDMTVAVDRCGLTDEEARAAGTTVTTSTGSAVMKTTTVCNKK